MGLNNNPCGQPLFPCFSTVHHGKPPRSSSPLSLEQNIFLSLELHNLDNFWIIRLFVPYVVNWNFLTKQRTSSLIFDGSSHGVSTECLLQHW